MMLDFNFINKAILAGLGIALVAGPLGAMIVWRRMSNFGDALGHSALLGVCLALLLHIHLYLGLMVVSLIVAGLLAQLMRHKEFGGDALLSMLAQSALALGLIMATYFEGLRLDLLGYLYGDILAVDNIDLIWILSVDVVVCVILWFFWRSFLSMTIHEDLARVEGLPVTSLKWILMLMLAAVFAIAMKLVGVLLITALLIIPALSARKLSKTPEQMVVLASILGMLAVFLGIKVSQYGDWPTGPAIVVAALLLFILSLVMSRLARE